MLDRLRRWSTDREALWAEVMARASGRHDEFGEGGEISRQGIHEGKAGWRENQLIMKSNRKIELRKWWKKLLLLRFGRGM